MIEDIKKIISPVHKRIMSMIARAVINTIADDTGIQRLQLSVFAGDVRDSVERFQEYGFTSHPLPGAEAAIVRVGGASNHMLVLAVDDKRYRIKSLEEGEVAIYTDEGDSIKLGRNNIITIQSDAKVIINADDIELAASDASDGSTVTVKGALVVTGDITDNSEGSGRSMASMRTIYNAHTHVETGSTTDAPGGTM